MSCINPNNPEFQKLLKLYDDPFTVEIEYRKLQEEKMSRGELINLDDLRYQYRIDMGIVNSKTFNKISVYNLTSKDVVNINSDRNVAVKSFNEDRENKIENISDYFITYFTNEILKKDATLQLSYNRLQMFGLTTPKLFIIDNNMLDTDSMMFEKDKTIYISEKNLQKSLLDFKGSFEEYENYIQKGAQEEAIHLVADYLTNGEDIRNIYSELSQQTIDSIKLIYRGDKNAEMSKDSIVHEYLRMVVQNKIFNTTTEIEVGKIGKATKGFLEKLIEFIYAFLDTIRGGSNTTEVVSDILDFMNNNLSKELIDKIKSKDYLGQMTKSVFGFNTISPTDIRDIKFVQASDLEINLSQLEMTPDVIDHFYNQTSKSLSKQEFSEKLIGLVGLFRGEDDAVNKITNEIKCL